MSSPASAEVSASVSMDIIRGGGPTEELSIVLLKLFLGVV